MGSGRCKRSRRGRSVEGAVVRSCTQLYAPANPPLPPSPYPYEAIATKWTVNSLVPFAGRPFAVAHGLKLVSNVHFFLKKH